MSGALEGDPLGYCRWCGARNTTDAFRDFQSLEECRIASACQQCQDRMFLGAGDEDPPVSHRIRHGVLVGAVRGDAPDEIHEAAILPFRFVIPLRRLVFDTRYIVRFGFSSRPADPWVELEPVRDAWTDMNVRVLCVPSPYNPILSNGLADRDFVIGLDLPTVRLVAARCPSARPTALVSLNSVLCQDAYGVPFRPLQPFIRAHLPDVDLGAADVGCLSSLGQCAVLARVLSLPATQGRDAGLTAFEFLLRSHALRFDETRRGEVS